MNTKTENLCATTSELNIKSNDSKIRTIDESELKFVAAGHGVQAQLQSGFIRIEDETFNRQSLQTGETLTLQGTLVSL